MYQILFKIADYFLSKKIRLSGKIALVIGLILAAYIVNDVTGFSFFYANDQKVVQIKQLNAILDYTASDDETRAFIADLRHEMMDRRNIFERIADFLAHREKKQNNMLTNVLPHQTARNDFLFLVSSGGLPFLIAFLVSFAIIFTSKRVPLLERIVFGVLSFVLFATLGLLLLSILNLVPQIHPDTWAWNYLLNICVQLLPLGLFFLVSKQKALAKTT